MKCSSMIAEKLILSSLFCVIALLTCSSCSRQKSYPSAPRIAQDIVIEVSGLEPDVPKFYSYQFHAKSISYFILKIDDRVSSFLDACASCYTHKQGYRYEDGVVICRYCNMKFPVNALKKGLGGCYPIQIEGRMDKGNYRIPVATLEKMEDKF